MNNDEQRVYYESEIKQVLLGLMNVYWCKPWWSRWMIKPWYDALETAMAILCSTELLEELDNNELLNSVDSFLEGD